MELNFDDFRKRAKDDSLSKWEKIGFPDEYRKNSEPEIFADIKNKIGLAGTGKKILDIGCGCSGLVELIINNAKEDNHILSLIDSEEMLNNIDKNLLHENIRLISGYFPAIDPLYYEKEAFDYIIVYSVIQYVFLEQSIYRFIHECISLLKPGGKLLIGDIPNVSARDRFLESAEGQKFQAKDIALNANVKFKHEKAERMDDAVILSILSRFRNFNCETYLLPQPKSLPFGNRREDILIIKR